MQTSDIVAFGTSIFSYFAAGMVALTGTEIGKIALHTKLNIGL